MLVTVGGHHGIFEIRNGHLNGLSFLSSSQVLRMAVMWAMRGLATCLSRPLQSGCAVVKITATKFLGWCVNRLFSLFACKQK